MLAAYLTLAGWIGTVAGRSDAGRLVTAALTVPLSVCFLVLTGLLLSNRRIPWTELLPFALAGALAESAYSIPATAYLPRYFRGSASRYGPVGAVFAMISTLFVVMLFVVGAGALGREIAVELARVRRGEAPPAGEVQQEWSNLLDQARLRWDVLRERVQARRHHRSEDRPEDP